MTVPDIKLMPADKKKLEDMEGDIAAMQREIAKAKLAGIDVEKLETDFNKSIKLREGILSVYG